MSAPLVLRGPGALAARGAALDALHRAAGTPLTARRTWLQAWCTEQDRAQEPVLLACADPADEGRLVAAAVLARRVRAGLRDYRLAGDGPSDYGAFAVHPDVPDAPDRLARAIAGELTGGPGPWRLRAAQLPAHDPTAARLLALLPHARRVPGTPSPMVDLAGPESVAPSRNTRKVLSRMVNRAERLGTPLSTEVVSDPERIVALMPELIAVRRARDRALDRVSDLDDARERGFVERVLPELARDGELELLVVRAGSRLAAYVTVLLDPPAYRLWDTRIAPELDDLSPGQLVVQAALEQAAARPGITCLDFMRGLEPYKLRTATRIVPAETLGAWSSGPVELVAELPRRSRAAARAAMEAAPALRRGWLAVKRRVLLRPDR